jgi:hypothetical protein
MEVDGLRLDFRFCVNTTQTLWREINPRGQERVPRKTETGTIVGFLRESGVQLKIRRNKVPILYFQGP